MVEQSEQPIGHFSWARPATPYETYMEEQGIPIVRGVGLHDARDVTLAPWKRMGGQGAFIQLDGTGGLTGMYLLEIPGGGAVNPEHHLYEEIFYVLEGRGTTEVWLEGSSRRQAFEWQAGSLFSAPLNTWHRLVNAASSPALVLGVTNAPPIMALYRNLDFIYNVPYHFSDRYDAREDYFKSLDEFGRDPETARARSYSNVLPDIVNCELPPDGQRAPGHRRFGWNLAGNTFQGFVAQYPSGRYSKCHAHESGPVLLCLGGKGYSITWPKQAGTRPWEEGKGGLVKRQDYVPGGMVSAAPGGVDAFHGHFGTSKEPLRLIAFLWGYPQRVSGAPGDEVIGHNLDIREGGATIEYRDEDPYIRKMYEEELQKEGAEPTMPEAVYH